MGRIRRYPHPTLARTVNRPEPFSPEALLGYWPGGIGSPR
jgi:hypothetical protein